MYTTLLAILFALVLVAGVPFLSFRTARNPEIRSMTRLNIYFSAIFSQWLLTLAGWVVAFVAARKVLLKGFGAVPLNVILGWGGGIAVAALLMLGVVIWGEERAWLPPESDLVYLMIPRTARERFWAAFIVAPTAAFCEEFLFRGYLLTELHDWLHSLVWAWVLSSLAFALAHCYQGWSGIIRAGLLGALLAYPVVRWGSLYPAMLAHWIIDTVALLWLGRGLIRKKTAMAGRVLE